MNVIGTRPDGWWKDRHGALIALVEKLESWARDGRRVTVVLERPPSPAIRSAVVEIAHAPAAAPNSADDEIVRLLHADPDPGQITVVTSDGALSDRVRNAGATVYPAARFRDILDRSGQ